MLLFKPSEVRVLREILHVESLRSQLNIEFCIIRPRGVSFSSEDLPVNLIRIESVYFITTSA